MSDGMLSQLLPAMERQQMFDRERVVVKDLHDRGICFGPKGCIICKEKPVEKAAEDVFPNPSAAGRYQEAMQLHEQGACGNECSFCRSVVCVSQQPSISDPIPQVPGTSTLSLTLHDRGRKYGDYGIMATCAQRIKEAMGPRANMSAVQRESLDVIATKIARLCCGDPNHYDSWHDIQGYAKLAEDHLPVREEGQNAATS